MVVQRNNSIGTWDGGKYCNCAQIITRMGVWW